MDDIKNTLIDLYAENTKADYLPELAFYNLIADTDLKIIRDYLKQPFSKTIGLGALSRDPLQNLKYHFVVTAALLSRVCIARGMSVATSYRLSDFYIQKADLAKKNADLDRLHDEMCLDYAKQMREVRREPVHSAIVARCIDYIHAHITEKIVIHELAAKQNLSPEHLSRTFSSEMHQSLSHYIRQQKLHAAKTLLSYSEYSIAEISEGLSFSSQSQFTALFRQEENITPSQYRKYSRRNFL